MRKLCLTVVLAAGVALLPAAAFASPITINGVINGNVALGWSTDGGVTVNVFASGTGSATGSVLNADGWNIQGNIGSTNTPFTYPQALSLNNTTATCVGTCSALQIYASSTGFTATQRLAEGFTNNSTFITGVSASQNAYWDSGNSFFGTANSFGSTLTLGGGNPLAISTNLLGPTPGVTPYSLTIEELFSPGAPANYTYTTSGKINAVPEPASLALLGTGLLGLGLVFKRYLVAGEDLNPEV